MRRSALALAVAACGGTPPQPAPTPATVTIPRVEGKTSVLAVAPREEPAPPEDAGPSGIFESELWNAGVLQKSETELFLDAAGGRGTYSYVEEERRIRGEIGLCRRVQPRQWTCQWVDEFGTGEVTFRFDADLRRFEGEWWTASEPTQKYPWNGARLDATSGEESSPDPDVPQP